MNFLGYFEEYTDVCWKHLESEFEVQIRDGKISNDSFNNIKTLSRDFKLLQIEDNVDNILVDNVTKHKPGHYLLKCYRQYKKALWNFS